MIFFFLFFSLIAGAVGAVAMNLSMRAMSRLGGGDEVDMIVALGSYFTGKKEHAARVGFFIHLASGIFFGLVYGLLFSAIGLIDLPQIFLIGLGFGFIHGMGMAYFLMIYLAEKHPLQEYREASLVIGGIHLAGHLVYGAVVGLVAGIGTLIGNAVGLS